MRKNNRVMRDLARNLTATASELNASVSQTSGQTPSDAEVNVLDGAIASVSFAVAAGTTNVCVFTGTIKDADGATIAAVKALRVYLSTSAAGAGVSATSYSTGATVTTGTTLVTVSANKVFDVLTNASGVFAVSITASGKPATEYCCAVAPITGTVSVSAASAALWGA